MGIIATAPAGIAQPRYETIGVGAARRLQHHLLGCIRAPVKDVVPYRAVQQGRILGDHADMSAQGVLTDLGYILPVDQDPAPLHVMETQQQIDQGGLARARAADQTDALIRADMQVEVLQHVAALAVVEADLIEANFSLADHQLLRILMIGYRLRSGNRSEERR